ncbi:MAG: transcription-repair coupling factor [Myxococcota bacterium]|jgi:transcription-repair coupling factor (superfamily II helicase)|nr:transcription-repair coupling factor [Myxococcota bacterium]
MSKPRGHSLDEVKHTVRKRTQPVRIAGVRGAARALVVAELVRAQSSRPVVLLTPNSRAADALAEDLRLALGEPEDETRVIAFPRHDTLPYERFSPQAFVVAQRMAVLFRMLEAKDAAREAPIVVGPMSALLARVPSRERVRGHTLLLEVGQTIPRDELIERLTGAGYSRVAMVEDPGEFAVRGGIVDLFPPHRTLPCRVEFFDDEIESLREFDPASQRSQQKCEHIAAPPPQELAMDREQVVARADAVRELALEQGGDEAEIEETLDALLRGSLPPGVEALGPVLQPDLESPVAFFPEDTLILVDDPAACRERVQRYSEEAKRNHESARDAGRTVAPLEDLMTSAGELADELATRNPVQLERLAIHDRESGNLELDIAARGHDELRRDLARARTHERALAPLVDRLALWMNARSRIVLTCAALSSAERLHTLLCEYGLEPRLAHNRRPAWRWSSPGRVEVRVADLSEGFELDGEGLVVVGEEEIFGKRERRHTKKTWQEGAAIDGLAQLAPGDYLVHSDHGIGTYRGLVELEAGRIKSELLCIEYLGSDRLFLPVHRLNLVQRFGGSDGTKPRIDRLGGATWEKAKRKVKKSLRSMASELLSLHAAREMAPGFAFAPRETYFEEFEANFPFEETPDQLAAIEDTLADMQRAKPMDRLVCGDVGYGKTEVALRAAFRAALDGKQVAVLVPTTVLCQQHYETFVARYEGYPIRVEFLSRFQTPARAREVVEGCAMGEIDVVVGTHRLLQKKMQFRDLGLLVIDEEQRFGVSHKERIKQLKKTVDVVTLTATPIPRTLQMAFTGVRDLSVINTPPADRFAIRTQVSRYDELLIREAILRETRRGGQVFFVHNRVQSIGEMAQMIEKVVPEVSFLVGHGQMKERELEDVMHAFMRGDADVLLCTTIIESGIDIPRANTIIINRAHTLGLAQMYQLRGRVGRSTHRAYAYLLVPSLDHLTHDAERRLEAIQDLSELGSGFRLANMDLEIRGAGNMLGAEQSGNLMTVGYDTYMSMLQETMEELRGEVHDAEIDPEIRLPVEARLPEDYVADVSQRLVLYKRASSARDEGEVARVRDEVLDRYGPLPPQAEHLFDVIRLKILSRTLGVAAVDVVRGELVLQVSEKSKIEPDRLVHLLGQPGLGLRVAPDHKIYAPAPPLAGGAKPLFEATKELLTRLGA